MVHYVIIDDDLQEMKTDNEYTEDNQTQYRVRKIIFFFKAKLFYNKFS